MNLANRLTILRILLVPVFIASLLYFSAERPYLRTTAILIYLSACLTDALDGYLARKMDQVTQLGSYIDPIADKILILSGYISLSFMAHLPEAMRVPAWVTLAVVTRDVFILIGAVIIFISTGALKAKPLFVSKVTTVVQMGALLASLLGLAGRARIALYILTAGFTLVSGVLYIRMGGEMLKES